MSFLQRAKSRVVGQLDYFPTQQPQAKPDTRPATLTEEHRRYGAPFGPMPRSFLRIPAELTVCGPLACEDEVTVAAGCRESFLIPGYHPPHMNDIIRAFRMVRGRRTYIEVGTFDRGNLAYAAHLLADDALMIGVDIQKETERDALVRKSLKPGQSYVSVVGDSRSPTTVRAVATALDGRKVDAVFIDGNHTAHGVLCDYVNFGELVAPGGVVMFHDALWEGDAQYKGSAHALGEIDRLDPIYLIDATTPVHRFMRPMWRDEIWGVVGVHVVTGE